MSETPHGGPTPSYFSGNLDDNPFQRTGRHALMEDDKGEEEHAEIGVIFSAYSDDEAPEDNGGVIFSAYSDDEPPEDNGGVIFSTYNDSDGSEQAVEEAGAIFAAYDDSGSSEGGNAAAGAIFAAYDADGSSGASGAGGSGNGAGEVYWSANGGAGGGDAGAGAIVVPQAALQCADTPTEEANIWGAAPTALPRVDTLTEEADIWGPAAAALQRADTPTEEANIWGAEAAPLARADTPTEEANIWGVAGAVADAVAEPVARRSSSMLHVAEQMGTTLSEVMSIWGESSSDVLELHAKLAKEAALLSSTHAAPGAPAQSRSKAAPSAPIPLRADFRSLPSHALRELSTMDSNTCASGRGGSSSSGDSLDWEVASIAESAATKQSSMRALLRDEPTAALSAAQRTMSDGAAYSIKAMEQAQQRGHRRVDSDVYADSSVASDASNAGRLRYSAGPGQERMRPRLLKDLPAGPSARGASTGAPGAGRLHALANWPAAQMQVRRSSLPCTHGTMLMSTACAFGQPHVLSKQNTAAALTLHCATAEIRPSGRQAEAAGHQLRFGPSHEVWRSRSWRRSCTFPLQSRGTVLTARRR